MMKITNSLIGVVLLASIAWAQTPTVISVDITKAQLTWSWAQGTGGVVVEFRIKCGNAAGMYTKTTVLADPAARTLPVASAIGGPGNWFCAVSAANQFGESPNSNEINFAAGNVPVAPSGLQILVQ